MSTSIEFMQMIDAKRQHEIDENRRKQIERDQKIEELTEKIRSNKARIDELISVANYARSHGIDFNNSGFGCHEGYDTGMFYTNGWSHLVGFVNGQPISKIGIIAGGACGCVDFMTDGVEVYGLNNGIRCAPLYEHLKRFVDTFDTFEEEFYKYIRKRCEIK